MTGKLAKLATTIAIAIVVAAAAQAAEGAVVSLRVESAATPEPLFEGTVTTLPHAVDGGDGSGPHPCSGPSGSAPTPTATGALDDALRGAGISWRGNWDPSFRDFFIERIGPYASAPPDAYWSLTVNGRFSAGGCLARVADGDSVRFFYGSLFDNPPEPDVPSGPAASPRTGDAPKGGERAASPPKLRRIAGAAERYLRRAEGTGEEWAMLALGVRDESGAARAARDLLGGRLDDLRPDGSLGGDVNATAIAVLGLNGHRPGRAARAAAWLREAQLASGGFGYRRDVPPDVDTTALATWALAVAGEPSAAQMGGTFLTRAQSANGGFAIGSGAEPNAQSTGLAIVALRVSGIGPRRVVAGSGLGPLDFLAAQARRNGSIAYNRRSDLTPVWTTAQALLGLTAKAKLLDLGANH